MSKQAMHMFKIFRFIVIGLIALQVQSCKQHEPTQPLATGDWLGKLHMQDQVLPFIFRVTYTEEKPVIHLINYEEEILIDSLQVSGDSIYIPMHIFDTEIRASLKDKNMKGVWIKNEVDGYQIPFTARQGKTSRFKIRAKPSADLSARWEMTFINGRDSTRAIALLKQQGNRLSGTVLTLKEDFRYLSGIVSGDSIKLSTFNGHHAYLFTGRYDNDTLSGDFWSGKDLHEKFFAVKNEKAQLSAADSLIYLNKEAEN